MVTAAGALESALKTLGATRIGFASPYVGAINRQAKSAAPGFSGSALPPEISAARKCRLLRAGNLP